MLVWKNTLVLVGVAFTTVASIITICFFAVGGFFAVFACVVPIPITVIGIFLLRAGLDRSRRWLDALEQGNATSGRLISVEIDDTEEINGEHPLKMTYEYDTPNETRRDVFQVWDRSNMKRPAGEHLWVVYMPGRSAAIWPPLR